MSKDNDAYTPQGRAWSYLESDSDLAAWICFKEAVVTVEGAATQTRSLTRVLGRRQQEFNSAAIFLKEASAQQKSYHCLALIVRGDVVADWGARN